MSGYIIADTLPELEAFRQRVHIPERSYREKDGCRFLSVMNHRTRHMVGNQPDVQQVTDYARFEALKMVMNLTETEAQNDPE